jgi:hypothetical protein
MDIFHKKIKHPSLPYFTMLSPLEVFIIPMVDVSSNGAK